MARRGTILAALSAVAAVAPGLLVAGGDARAVELRGGESPVTLAVTESLFADYHFELDDPALEPDPERVFDLRNRLNTRLGWRRLTLGLRLDGAWFPDPPSGQYDSDLRLEEVFVTWRTRRAVLTAGDDYVSFGRGIALSLRKVDEVGFDVSLRGAHVIWRHPSAAVQVHAGLTNVVNVDAVEEKLVPDPHDLVLAGRAEVQPLRWLRLGVHGVDVERRHSDVLEAVSTLVPGRIDHDPLSGERFERSWIVGGTLEMPSLWGALDLYAEVDHLRTRRSRETAGGVREDVDDGLAVYGSATAYAGRWTVLVEAKHYDDFELESTPHPDTFQEAGITTTFPYVAPPTLERIDQRVQNNADVRGAHVRVDRRLDDSDAGHRSQVFASAAGFLDAPEQDHFTVHAYAGWEWKHPEGHRSLLQVGYRHEDAPEGNPNGLRMVHADLDVHVLLAPRHDLQVHWSHEDRNLNPDAGVLRDHYVEGTAYVTWNFSPHWALTAQLDYLNDDDHEDQPLFPGGWVMYRFTQSTFVRLFAGRSKGGLKCSGGICRIFPDFEGLKLESAVRF